MSNETDSCGVKIISYSFNSTKNPPESDAVYICAKDKCPLADILQTGVIFTASGQNMNKSKLTIDRNADKFFRAKCPYYAKEVKTLD